MNQDATPAAVPMSMTVPSSYLPAEVLDGICTSLDGRDVRAFRLVNRSFSRVADQYLLDSVTFASDQRRRTIFKSVCNHEYFRHRVRRLVYNTTEIKPVQHYHEFVSLFRDRNCDYDEEAVLVLYKRYDAACRSARQLKEHSQLDLILGLDHLPNLKAIEFSRDDEGSGYFLDFPFLSCTTSEYPFYHFTPTWHGEYPLVWTYISKLHYVQLMHAVHRSSISIAEFSHETRKDNGTIDWHKSPILERPTRRTQCIGHQYPIAFTFFSKHLVRLSLNLIGRRNFFVHMTKMLRQTPLVEDLSVTFGTSFFPQSLLPDNYLDNLRTIFGPTCRDYSGQWNLDSVVQLPRLRRLSCEDLWTNAETLIWISQAHVTILKELTLRNILMIGPRDAIAAQFWNIALETLQSLQLEKVVIKNVDGFTRVIVRDRGNNQDSNNAEGSSATEVAIGEYGMGGLLSLQTIPLGARRNRRQIRRHVELASIQRDRDELEPRIIDYIMNKTTLNPLVGLDLHQRVL